MQLTFSEHMSSQSKAHFAALCRELVAEANKVGEYDHIEEEYHADCLARDLDYIEEMW